MSMPTWDLPDGKRFEALERHAPDTIPILDHHTEGTLRGWLLERWRRAYMAKLPELDRNKTQEKYYSGFHYNDAMDNRNNPVTNFCFGTVETVWANSVESSPVPEIKAAKALTFQKAQLLSEYARWVVRATRFAQAVADNERVKYKHGTAYYLTVVDPETGICWPKTQSIYDFYKDPFARDVDELQYFFIAGPVPTRWLQNQFPQHAKNIKADGIMSPSYDVLYRPYFDAVGVSGNTSTAGATFPGFHASKEGSPFDPTGTDVEDTGTQLVAVPDAYRDIDSDTTFLIQMFVRDYSKMPVKYLGDIIEPDPTDEALSIRTPAFKSRAEPCCSSGWRVIQMTARGLFVDPGSPLDDCFLGLPIVKDVDYKHEGRWYGVGELDNLIPLNRQYNRRSFLLNRALEFEALPILLMDEDAGTDLDERAAEPGEALKKKRGTEVGWLKFNTVAAQQFEMRAIEAADMQRVTGVQDAQMGQRPAGIEAGVALRELQRAAQTRIRGKEPGRLMALAQLLKKCMYATGKKALHPISFMASDGQLMSIDPSDLLLEYDIEFAQGSGSALSKEVWNEQMKEYFQLGIVDEEAVIKANPDIPDQAGLLQRIAERRMLEAEMARSQAAQGGPPEGGGGSPA